MVIQYEELIETFMNCFSNETNVVDAISNVPETSSEIHLSLSL